MKKKWLVGILILATLGACHSYKSLPALNTNTDWKVQVIPSSQQSVGGDPEAGLEYVLTGDYVGTGIPYEVFKKRSKRLSKLYPTKNELNQEVPFLMNVFEAPNGVEVVSGNCFSCHAATIDNKIVLGVGNYASDFTANLGAFAKGTNAFMKVKYGKDAQEWAAYEDFSKFFAATTDAIETQQIGPNPAARLAEACMKHRNPTDLTYEEEPLYEVYEYNLGSDVPPLWNVKKKNALYYTGVGQGDFTKLLMQASVLGSPDSTHARSVQENFVDVLAWLNSLEPPAYPYEINQALATEGKSLFETNCSKCHGTYGEEETYPNKVVSLNLIKTDPYYATYATKSGITDWYNKSWFATSEPQSKLAPYMGYVAPPLDGIWATAPYLHNGAVPTIDALLNSDSRPTYWKRDLSNYDFDESKLGWNYEEKNSGSGKDTYDTTISGYGNMGHYFGDNLESKERKAVIEYLKTL